MKEGLPWVTAKTAQTIDGKIATNLGESQWITSKYSRDLGRQWRKRYDAIMVGINTVLKDDPRLNCADTKKALKKVIIDSKLKIPLKARLFKNTSAQNVIIITTSQAPNAKVKALASKARVWTAPSQQGKVNLRWAFKELAKDEVTTLLIEGGGALIGAAMNEGLVDQMQIFIAASFMGKGLDSLSGLKAPQLANLYRLSDINVQKLGEDILIEGRLHVHRDH
jgi:diaminohydroxyphosphoribosylaminopyrimidine deaminase / 5-amino-6-(5-phosphoribosylamino)uracil reductase